MKERAYAKINLCLDVIGKREDGYHELKMVMVPIFFFDVLEMLPAKETTMTLNRNYLPVDEKNTVIKAIEVMRRTYGFDMNFECHLRKHIPTRAGLAGGSADAAAAIRMIDRMLDLDMTTAEMLDAAKQVGSDVQFCILNKPAIVEGTGDIIKPFQCKPDMEILLVKPRYGVSTKDAYDLIDQGNDIHPDCEAMKQALINNDFPGIVANLGNSLEQASLQLCDEIRVVKERLSAMGFEGVLMSGSGSTVFGLTQNRDLLNYAQEELRKESWFVRSTRILGTEYNRF